MKPATPIDSQDLDQHVQEVSKCPRCGADHGEQVFQRLKRPMDLPGSLFEFWWTCPATREPVIAEVAEVVPP